MNNIVYTYFGNLIVSISLLLAVHESFLLIHGKHILANFWWQCSLCSADPFSPFYGYGSPKKGCSKMGSLKRRAINLSLGSPHLPPLELMMSAKYNVWKLSPVLRKKSWSNLCTPKKKFNVLREILNTHLQACALQWDIYRLGSWWWLPHRIRYI